jgi:hypothetical protein
MEAAIKMIGKREWILIRVLAVCLTVACIVKLWLSFSSGYIEFGTRKSHFIIEGGKLWIGQLLMLDSAIVATFLAFHRPPPKLNTAVFNKAAMLAGGLWFILFIYGAINGRVVG